MANFKIYPICLGRTERKGIETPILSFYVTDGQNNIIVDTGGVKADGIVRMPYYQEEDETLDKKLSAMGVYLNHINMVILTHLHWDHMSNNHLFTNAKFYVQKLELHYAVTPIPIHAPGYDLELIFKTKYDVINGDEEIIDGISVLLVSGHSPGSQCVIVRTDAGNYAIAGDFIAQYRCWESNPRIAGDIHTDLVTYYDSFRKLEKYCDYILPGHDYKVLENNVYPN